ncbi:hypothetical protein L2E82_12655 [Cichorium intybus]|uniref:Uncharacterized protein n=1 Tax=Cichorium intybus TaxID=13427 RepID=A0ACB9GGH7_CICIN|nr:hypothetical protein L2E82_12655 [Cichorium intybus]
MGSLFVLISWLTLFHNFKRYKEFCIFICFLSVAPLSLSGYQSNISIEKVDLFLSENKNNMLKKPHHPLHNIILETKQTLDSDDLITEI